MATTYEVTRASHSQLMANRRKESKTDLSILDSYLELDLDSILAPCIVSVGTPIRPAREQREGCLPQFLTPLFLFSQ
jgi:hypothetical protein